MNILNIISNKRIVLALGMIVVVAAVVVSGTGAFFSDSETSANNVFTAGAINLTVDHSKQTYNGVDCKTCSVTIFSDTSNQVVAPIATTSAVLVTLPHPAWTADVDGAATTSKWIWATDPTTVADTTNGITYTFRKTFNWMGPIAGATLNLGVAADNGYTVWLNGVQVGGDASENNFQTATQDTITGGVLSSQIVQGLNVLEIKVTNKPLAADPVTGNPAGLLYQFTINGNCAKDSDFQKMCTLWSAQDLKGQSFFNFNDVKPGDMGTDVISLHVTSNDAYSCLFPHGIKNLENTLTEPEIADGDTSSTTGELGALIQMFAWNDTNQNGAFDGAETVISGPTAFNNGFMANGTILANGTNYVGLAWCAGVMATPVLGSPFSCNGATVNNVTQTDSVSAYMTAYAVQQRNNANFSCKTAIPDVNAYNPVVAQ